MLVEKEKFWVDLVKGGVLGIVLWLILLALSLIIYAQQISNLPLFLSLLLVEALLLFWFVFRGNGKRVMVNWLHFCLGILIVDLGSILLLIVLQFVI